MEQKKNNTKMWSYKLTHDSLFAPNPFWGILTLATCKPVIRRSKNSRKGTWIAGWTACVVHNADAYGGKIDHYNMGQEKLIFLAQIDENISLDDYWHRYPQKRNYPQFGSSDARFTGDNIYHKEHTDSNGNVIAEYNECGHTGPECAAQDYQYGKNSLICKRFFYFTRENRLEIPEKFRGLVQKSRGQSLKCGPLIDEFIEFVENQALQLGVSNGIIGELPVVQDHKDNDNITDFTNFKIRGNIKGCAK